jgi:DNA (cytosine-5)-methyltransferase 1
MITIGSLFSGIGGFELGLERAIPNSKTIWQCEQDKYCRSILQKHWPEAKMYTDIRDMNTDEIERPDIICGGFPCQDISVAGKGVGIHGKKSGLWWQMLRIISDLRPRISVLENVPAITFRGGREVLGSLASIGYDAEWTVISAKQFGAPHLRRRWFLVAYPNSISQPSCAINAKALERNAAYPSRIQEKGANTNMSLHTRTRPKNYWQKSKAQSPLCSLDDGIPRRLARLKALGNAIVPQCSEYIGQCIVKSGLLEETV